MAKVMISMPDDVLMRLDRLAGERGTTRSGLLRELVRRELGGRREARRSAIEELLGHARDHGGDSAAAIRADRSR